MQLLSIFDFYYFHEFSMPAGTNWPEVIVTAILSGLVAWSAAFVQITIPRYHSKNDEISEATQVFSMFQQNLKSVMDISKEFNDYLLKSKNETSYNDTFNIPEQSINTSSFKVIENLSYKELNKYLAILKVEEADKPKILKAYSSSAALHDNYLHIRNFLNIKHKEYNTLVEKINDVMELIAIGVQRLVFSQEHIELVRHFETIPYEGRALFRKRNSHFQFLQDLDKLTGSYQQQNDSSWPIIENYILGLKGIVEKYKIQFPDIILAQNITKAIVLLKNLKAFYSTFCSTYKSYYEVNDKYIENIDSVLKISMSAPSINWFSSLR